MTAFFTAVSADQALTGVLERTLAKATARTKRIFGRNPMKAEEVEAFLKEMKLATLSTVKRSGEPHALPGSFAYLDEKLYFYGHPSSLRYRNLLGRNDVAVTVLDEWRRQVIIEGKAKIVGKARDLSKHKIAQVFREKYGRYSGDTESSSEIAEVTPFKIFTYKSQ